MSKWIVVRKLSGNQVEKQVQDRDYWHDFGIRDIKLSRPTTID
jgi:hypothetical protein